MNKNENENNKEKNNKKNKVDVIIKILTLGSTTVGKTTFIWKFTENEFLENTLLTVGIDIKNKAITMENGKKIRADFFDTAGQERHKSISFNLVKKADGIILMYDISLRKTYDDIAYWMQGIMENKEKNFPILLIGNKCDLEEERQVTYEEGKELAKKYNIDFMEISNKKDINVQEAGNLIINKILETKEKKKTKNENENVKLTKESQSKKKKWSFSNLCPFF